MVSWRPGPVLRPLLGPVHGYRQAGGEPGIHRGVASPWLTMILTWDEPLVLARGTGLRGYPDLVGGLHLDPETIVHDGRQEGVQVSLSPLGASALLGLPAGELAFANVEGAAVLPGLAVLRERLGEAADWPARFTLIEEFLLGRLDRRGAGEVRPEVAFGWRRLLQTRGAVGVADLAAETGWSERYLRRRFTEQVGMPPSALRRIVRFDAARTTLRARTVRGAPLGLAELAFAAGYTDQAHLSREFRAFTGLPPLRYAAAEFGETSLFGEAEPGEVEYGEDRSVQDPSGLPGRQ
ncbi:AraC family transcriptional regulator [Actinocorallia herbida]|uniref:AraC family transcriptional regulator n=1 Tax=Actinocorallia herbida TaxID=58109 RepID=A0A3N1D723_9ACTN|nr:helix-turn-helix domain-containing protein [Actinocorallia herbida]ROO89321.1 AraC family transcriptional regulator [Actinocorallia herbida]